MSEFVIPTRGELLAAVDVLEQLSAIYGLEPEFGEWSAADIRNEIDAVGNLLTQENLWSRVAARIGDYLHGIYPDGLDGKDIDDAVMEVFRERRFTLAEEPF